MSKDRWWKSVRDAGRGAGRTAEEIAGRRQPGPGRFLLVGMIGAGLGALAAYLFDPQRGRSRRARYADQAAALARDVGRNIGRGSRYVTSTVEGKAEAIRHAGEEAMPNDASLAMKVESELFRDPEVPKGSININVEQGIVVLRGEVPGPDMKERLEKSARAVPGVWEVENLLHLPGEPAPTVR